MTDKTTETEGAVKQIYDIAWRVLNERPVERGLDTMLRIAQEASVCVEATNDDCGMTEDAADEIERLRKIEVTSRVHHGDYRSDAEWMATYIMGRMPDHNTMTLTEIADYEQKLREIVERVADGIGKP